MMADHVKKQFDLSGRVAVITGAAGLLGREHAIALAQCNAIVVITDIDGLAAERLAQDLARAYPEGTFVSLVMNVADHESVVVARDKLIAQQGRVDILINNAAIDPKVKPGTMIETSRFENFPLEDWQFQINVGLTGAFLCSQVFGSWMAANGGGVILNIASDLSVIAPDQRIYRKADVSEDQQPVKPVTYSVIKTGLIGLTRYLATYWADKNVRVNALSPGGVYVNQPDGFVKQLTNLIPLRRMAQPDEYHGAVQFLCSEISSYVTGQNIVIDGGRSAW